MSAAGYAPLQCPIDLYSGHDIAAQLIVVRPISATPPPCARAVTLHSLAH